MISQLVKDPPCAIFTIRKNPPVYYSPLDIAITHAVDTEALKHCAEVHMLQCQKCDQRYIGTTGRQLKHRLADHRGYIINQVTSRATGAHFNLPGHSLAHLKVTILEQTRSNDEEYRKEREKYFIRKFDTYNLGINKEW
jgi:hypothetical protein